MKKVPIMFMFALLALVLTLGFASQQAGNVDANTDRIIGGEEVQPGAYPWMAALVNANDPDALNGHFCGGALIAQEWVLTAAHCFESDDPTQVDVVLGRHTLSSNEGQRHSVAQIILHPNYDENTNDSDIALLRLATASAQPTISVITPATANLANPGVNAIVAGWGNMDPDGGQNFPDALQQVTVPIISNETCNSPQSYDGGITDNMLCAGFAAGGQDSCQGDSGGPLMAPNAGGNGWVHVGVVSFGAECAQPNFYGVYARVSMFHAWVESHTGPLVPPPPPPPPPGPGTTFEDVPATHWSYQNIEKLFQAGITTGCSQIPPLYCPEQNVTRAEMAVFLLRGLNEPGYQPPQGTGTLFADVPITHWAVDWIEQLYAEGITVGCDTDPLRYCPNQSVTRAEMAVFLLRVKYGAEYVPPVVTESVFVDVPLSHWAVNWIAKLAEDGITTGVTPSTFDPEGFVTRAQMAAFLVRTFELP